MIPFGGKLADNEQVRAIKGNGNRRRMYLLRTADAIKYVRAGYDIWLCPEKQHLIGYYVFDGVPTECPVCKRTIIDNLDFIHPGVYVDVSRKEQMTLGFLVIGYDLKVEDFWSETAICQHSTMFAELEAVIKAKLLYPNSSLFCDYLEVCRNTEATCIHRAKNPAHRVAKERLNFQIK